MKFTLAPNDARLGTYAEDGSIALWPEKNLLGQSISRFVTTTKRVGVNQFVVLPLGTADEYEVEVADMTKYTEPPEGKTRKSAGG